MEGIIQIADFYKSLKKTIYDNLLIAGHFDIVKVEDLPTREGKEANYLRQSYYKVSLVYGHSKIHYPDHSFEINGAALVFTNPKISYRWERISNGQKGWVCIFTKDFLLASASPEDFLVYQSVDCSVFSIQETLAEKLKATFLEMSYELRGDYRFKYDLLRHMLIEILHQGQKNAPRSANYQIGTNANERITYLFLELLERQFPIENSSQKVLLSTPGQFADALHIHVNHLNKALREVLGTSTSTQINNRFMLEAKNLLKGTTWAINEISSALGFDESNHFSAFFKRYAGINPNRFRSLID